MTQRRETRRILYSSLIIFLALILWSPEAFSDDKGSKALEAKASRYAQGLLKKDEAVKLAKALRNISRKKPGVRQVYYGQIVKAARSYVETAPGGPFSGAAHVLLCGSETCEPATYREVSPGHRKAEAGHAGRSKGEADHKEGEASAPTKLSESPPQYTEIARWARIEGTVIVQAIIDEQGDVTDVVVLRGLPMGLTESSVRAIEQWKFAPATLDGEPVTVCYNLTVNFTLR